MLGLVAVLLAIVAWAAPGITGRAGADGASRTAPDATGVINVIVGALWGAGGAVLVYVVVTIRRRRVEVEEPEAGQPRKAWWLPWLAAFIILATIIGPIALIRGRAFNGSGGPNPSTVTPSVPPSMLPVRQPRTPSAWTILAVAAGAAAASFVLFRGRQQPIEPEPLPLPEELIDAVDESIHDIESEPDARRAIIRAYARMERALARGGVPRRPSETPFEYVETTLRRLMVPPEPVRALTGLFELARFSDRHLDAAMKQRAIDCLLDVRFALAAEVA